RRHGPADRRRHRPYHEDHHRPRDHWLHWRSLQVGEKEAFCPRRDVRRESARGSARDSAWVREVWHVCKVHGTAVVSIALHAWLGVGHGGVDRLALVAT